MEGPKGNFVLAVNLPAYLSTYLGQGCRKTATDAHLTSTSVALTMRKEGCNLGKPQACEVLVGEWRAGTIERLGARGRGTRQGPIDLEAFQGVQMENARWGRGNFC